MYTAVLIFRVHLVARLLLVFDHQLLLGVQTLLVRVFVALFLLLQALRLIFNIIPLAFKGDDGSGTGEVA